jgi:hypothetical protein
MTGAWSDAKTVTAETSGQHEAANGGISPIPGTPSGVLSTYPDHAALIAQPASSGISFTARS